MFCERCKNNEATIHLTEIIKDVKSEVHLCEGCARDIGLNSKLSNFSLSVPEMLSFLDITEVDEFVAGTACKNCGITYMDFSRDGKLGCPDCYRHLGDSLKSVIVGFHGSMKHVGKHPGNLPAHEDGTASLAVQTLHARKSLDEIKKQLNKAVLEERYEEAAVLRDRINEIETG